VTVLNVRDKLIRILYHPNLDNKEKEDQVEKVLESLTGTDRWNLLEELRQTSRKVGLIIRPRKATGRRRESDWD